MALSKSDAHTIFNCFFREPVLSSDSRKYTFRIENLSQSSFDCLKTQLSDRGSSATEAEIRGFIDGEIIDSPIELSYLQGNLLLSGEIFKLTIRSDSRELTSLRIIKFDEKNYLVMDETNYRKGYEINLDKDTVFSCNSLSPLQNNEFIDRIQLHPVPRFYRLVDSILLDDRYVYAKPCSLSTIYSLLSDAHRHNSIVANWQDILNSASNAGISTYTIFNLLEYICCKENGRY